MSAELICVSISNGDAVLFVNGAPVYTQEAIDTGETVSSVAESLANALQVGLQVMAVDVPSDPEWTWPDVYELLPVTRSATQPKHHATSIAAA